MYNDNAIEQRLDLIQKLRSEQMLNTEKIRKREEIMHPGLYSDYESRYSDATERSVNQSASKKFTGFKLRLFAALLLFIAFLYLDISGQSIMGLSTTAISGKVSETFSINSFDFMKLFPYTLDENKETTTTQTVSR